jgi:nitrogen-specific signal transduction histidine kinase
MLQNETQEPNDMIDTTKTIDPIDYLRRLAHDIRNPLCAIMTAATQAKVDLADGDSVSLAEDLDAILTAADSIEAMLKRRSDPVAEEKATAYTDDTKEKYGHALDSDCR